MLKVKIFSLYFFEQYFVICSEDILQGIVIILDISFDLLSEIQYVVMCIKDGDWFYCGWLFLMFVLFLFCYIIGKDGDSIQLMSKEMVKQGLLLLEFLFDLKKFNCFDVEFDFDVLLKWWKVIGEKSEVFVLECEKVWLELFGFVVYVSKIKDVIKCLVYGYDFQLFFSVEELCYIEVKMFISVGYQ